MDKKINRLYLTEEELNWLVDGFECFLEETSPEPDKALKELSVKIGLADEHIKWIDRMLVKKRVEP